MPKFLARHLALQAPTVSHLRGVAPLLLLFLDLESANHHLSPPKKSHNERNYIPVGASYAVCGVSSPVSAYSKYLYSFISFLGLSNLFLLLLLIVTLPHTRLLRFTLRSTCLLCIVCMGKFGITTIRISNKHTLHKSSILYF